MPRSFFRHPGQPEASEIGGFVQGADLRHPKVAEGLLTSAAREAITGAHPPGLGEFGGGALGSAVEGVGGGELGAEVRVRRSSIARLLEPGDRLLGARCSRCTHPMVWHQMPRLGSRGLSRMARSTSGIVSSIDPEPDPAVLGCRGLAVDHRALQLRRTTHRVDDAGEFRQPRRRCSLRCGRNARRSSGRRARGDMLEAARACLPRRRPSAANSPPSASKIAARRRTAGIAHPDERVFRLIHLKIERGPTSISWIAPPFGRRRRPAPRCFLSRAPRFPTTVWRAAPSSLGPLCSAELNPCSIDLIPCSAA